MDIDQIGLAFKATFGKDFDPKILLAHVGVQLQLREEAFYANLIAQMETERLIALREKLDEKAGDNDTGHAPQKPGVKHPGVSYKGRK